jgi:hypothetical protein
VRRLHPPTLAQWTCAHLWKTTTSRPGKSDAVRVRYLTCRHCGLKVKTEERLAVPWNERDFMELVVQTFPEDTMVDMETLRTHSLLREGLVGLNARLVHHGWQLELVKDQRRLVGVVRRRISPKAVEDRIGEVDKGKKGSQGKGGR